MNNVRFGQTNLLSFGYAPTIWVALAAMFAGMYLAQLRARAALAAWRETSEG